MRVNKQLIFLKMSGDHMPTGSASILYQHDQKGNKHVNHARLLCNFTTL